MVCELYHFVKSVKNIFVWPFIHLFGVASLYKPKQEFDHCFIFSLAICKNKHMTNNTPYMHPPIFLTMNIEQLK